MMEKFKIQKVLFIYSMDSYKLLHPSSASCSREQEIKNLCPGYFSIFYLYGPFFQKNIESKQ
jgi:hypothetical protein